MVEEPVAMTIMELLKVELSPESYGELESITMGFQGPPFRINNKRKEFIPSDEWFGLSDVDADSDTDDDDWDAGGMDPDELMDLALECCGILNLHKKSLDLTGLEDIEPKLTKHTLTVPMVSEEVAERVMKALLESGYKDVMVAKSEGGLAMEVPFTALTEWEYSYERSSLMSMIELTVRCCEGKSMMAEKI